MRLKDTGWVLVACVLLGVVAASSASDIEDWRFSAHRTGERVELTLRSPGFFSGNRVHTHLDLASFEGLSVDSFQRGGGPLEFQLVRDAGTITFYADAARKMKGTISFAPDPEFEALLVSLGDSSPDEDDLFRLARNDVGRPFVQRILDLGYTRVRAADLVRLHSHEVPLSYLEAFERLGYRPELDQLLRLYVHGFDEADVDRYAQLNLTGIPVSALLRLYNRGVDPQWTREMLDAGIEMDDQAGALVRLHAHGVDPELVAQANRLEVESALDDLIRFRSHGVTPEELASFVERGLVDLSPHEIVSLNIRGVRSEYVEALRRSGWGELSIEEMIRLDNHAISASYLKGVVDSGMRDADLQDVVTLSNHGIEVDYFTPLAARGHDADEIVRLRSHGVAVDLVRRLGEAGYDELSVSELIDVRNRGLEEFLTRRKAD